jgi:hypothetical protein
MNYSIKSFQNIIFLFFLSLTLLPSSAFAGSDYATDKSRTEQGGGTWGAMLQLAVQDNGPTAHFFVSKKDGTFTVDNKVQIRSGSHRGPVLTEGQIRRGVKTAELLLDLDYRHEEDTSYYAYLSNSYGHAWVGPVYIPKHTWGNISEPVGKRGRSNLSRPLLSEEPNTVALNEHVHIRVTAGSCPNTSAVQVRCSAEDSNWPITRPYVSGWIRPGSTVAVPLTFSRLGQKRISCVTLDQCCSSPVSHRTLQVVPNNRPPQPPEIRLASTSVEAHNVILLGILPGQDPDKDPVRVECTADDSNRTVDRPYLSGWFNVPRWTDAHFVFFRSGSKQVSCVTVDRTGQKSLPTIRRLQVVFPSPPPPPSNSHGTRIETKIEISIISDLDGNNRKIRMDQSRPESLHPYGEIRFDRPYIPNYDENTRYADDFVDDPFEHNFPSSGWQQQLP